jgi:SAM-dependent methyltransferase
MAKESSRLAAKNCVRYIKRKIKSILFRHYIFHHKMLHGLGVLPFSRNFGRERGTPVGRYYVESFLRKNSQYVRGRCLEFGDSRYRKLFPKVQTYQVVDLLPHAGVDLVCDIHDISSMPSCVFDSIICTQVFEHLAYPEKAAQSLHDLLVPGGVVLLTAPFISPIHYVPTDFRRFTPACLKMILEDAGLVVDEIDYGGNSLVGTGSLLGMVQEDFSRKELEYKDPSYPYNILVMAHRPVGLACVAPLRNN